jgi:transcriptional regulator with XRE-family HTH domain
MARAKKARASAAAQGPMKDFGPRLRQLREGRGLSQGELARLLGIDPMQTNRYERGLNLPSAETIVKLAQILRVTADELLTGRREAAQAAPEIRSIKLLDKFQALDQLPKEEQETALNILEGVIAKYELGRLAERMRKTA